MRTNQLRAKPTMQRYKIIHIGVVQGYFDDHKVMILYNTKIY